MHAQVELLPQLVRTLLFPLQSATQPRLSYAEMTEDYPRYPDIHDLDLMLLSPRMIVVRAASRRSEEADLSKTM